MLLLSASESELQVEPLRATSCVGPFSSEVVLPLWLDAPESLRFLDKPIRIVEVSESNPGAILESKTSEPNLYLM